MTQSRLSMAEPGSWGVSTGHWGALVHTLGIQQVGESPGLGRTLGLRWALCPWTSLFHHHLCFGFQKALGKEVWLRERESLTKPPP